MDSWSRTHVTIETALFPSAPSQLSRSRDCSTRRPSQAPPGWHGGSEARLRGRAAATWSWRRCIRRKKLKRTRKRRRTTCIDDVGRRHVHHLSTTNANRRLPTERSGCSFVCGGSSAMQATHLHPSHVGRRRRPRVEGAHHTRDVQLRIRYEVIRTWECTTSEPAKLVHRVANASIHPRRVGLRRFRREDRRVHQRKISGEQRRSWTTLSSQRRMQARLRGASLALSHDQVRNRNGRRWRFAAAQIRGTSAMRRRRTKRRHHVWTVTAVDGI